MHRPFYINAAETAKNNFEDLKTNQTGTTRKEKYIWTTARTMENSGIGKDV